MNFYYYAPGGTSAKNLRHWLQIIDSHEIREFDYGENKNMEIYKQNQPPLYNLKNLENMEFDIFITISDEDPYCVPEDYETIFSHIKKARLFKKEINGYNHNAYIWGKNAHIELYKDIYDFLLK